VRPVYVMFRRVRNAFRCSNTGLRTAAARFWRCLGERDSRAAVDGRPCQAGSTLRSGSPGRPGSRNILPGSSSWPRGLRFVLDQHRAPSPPHARSPRSRFTRFTRPGSSRSTVPLAQSRFFARSKTGNHPIISRLGVPHPEFHQAVRGQENCRQLRSHATSCRRCGTLTWISVGSAQKATPSSARLAIICFGGVAVRVGTGGALRRRVPRCDDDRGCRRGRAFYGIARSRPMLSRAKRR
jgi:hypothetical protein